MTLTEFLLARIAKDREIALAATPGPWYWEEPSGKSWPQAEQSLLSRGKQENGSDVSVLYGWGYDASGIEGELADREHIARHDPARVLAECEAKRLLVERDAGQEEHVLDGPCLPPRKMPGTWMLRVLALAYADHPDYLAEWRP